MKKKFYLINTVLIASVMMLVNSCVTTKLPDSYSVNPEVLEAKGGKVAFTVNGTIPEKSFHKKAVVEFHPYIQYDGKTQDLKKFVLRGEKTEGEGTVINSKTGGSFTYSDEFDYTDDMRASELWVKATITKGKKVIETDPVKLADGIITTYKKIVHDEDLSYAPSGYEKVTIVPKKATVYFKVNMANLNFNCKLNKAETAKAEMDSLDVFLKKGWAIKDVNINAWASPEGEIDFNDDLSDRRAETAQKYIEKKLKSTSKDRAEEQGVAPEEVDKDVAFNAHGNGEDWDGFMTGVRGSNLKDKSMILNIVNSQNDASKREQEIRNMTQIYSEIEDEILPPLRRAEIIVSFYEPKRTDEEIARLAVTYPDSLTYPELLHAATLTEDHQAKFNIYKEAFTHRHRDWRTYNNAAAEAINLGNIDDAENILVQAQKLSSNNGMIENNLGVVACHRDDWTKAEQYFKDAQMHGENENYNLGIVMIQKGEYQKALSYFNGISCRHNVALAQVLAGNMNEALKNLKCSPENPKTYYMLAVYGARTGNDKMVYEYLGKALEMHPKCKNKVAEDREFIKYFDNPEFQKIVQ